MKLKKLNIEWPPIVNEMKLNLIVSFSCSCIICIVSLCHPAQHTLSGEFNCCISPILAFYPHHPAQGTFLADPARSNDPAQGTSFGDQVLHLPCPRNGRRLRAQGEWQMSNVFSRGQNLTSNTLISALASVHYDTPLEGPALWVCSVRDILVRDPRMFEGNDLSSLIVCCQSLSSRDVGCQFLQLLSTVQVIFKCQQ